MKILPALSVVIVAIFGAACGPSAEEKSVTVTRFTQDGEGSVNSWIVEDEANRIVIDAQRSLSAGNELANALRDGGKPLRAIILTHPHPDHFGGLGSLAEQFPDTPILSSPITQRIMRNDENGFIALTKQVLGDDAPDEQPISSRTFEDGEALSWGDITLIADERGVGEADSMTVLFAPDEGFLFVGDIVDNGMTPFLMEGHTREWLLQLGSMQADYGDRDLVVFPGHGPRADSTLFREGEEFLTWVRSAVGEKLSDGLSESEIDDIADRYHTLYPSRPAVAAVPNLMRENIRAVAEELMSEQ